MFYDNIHDHKRHHPGHKRGHRHGLHGGRKLSSEDLQLVLLSLLDQGDAHGYELIKALDERSNGFYVPSPGMIYPSLTFLEEVGRAEVAADGHRKRYRLTDAGRQHLAEHYDHAAGILTDLAEIGANMENARRALARERSLEEDLELHSEGLRSVRQELKTFLRTYEPTGLEDDARIIGVLQRTLAKLRGVLNPAVPDDDLLQLMQDRRSLGLSRLRPDPVDRHLIERMLEAANWAPSHGDTEPWRFTVFTGQGRARLAELFVEAQRADGKPDDTSGAWKRAFAAPVWISIGMAPMLNEDGSLVMTLDEELMAVACAVQNLHLMVQALGLAGMWHSKGTSVHPSVARGIGLEPPSQLLGFFMCGWPGSDGLTGTRRPYTEKVSWFDGPEDSTSH